METQFNWFSNDPPPLGAPDLAPPPVSFGFGASGTLSAAPTSRGLLFDSRANVPLPEDAQSIPLSLTAKHLTQKEFKTYLRWYSDILVRTNQRTVSIADVYHFLGNFRISADTKDAINRIFSKIMHLINIGEFYALLRVISHALQGQMPSRALIQVLTAVPTPPSILCKKRLKDDNNSDDDADLHHPHDSKDNDGPLDIDLFTQFMLTGERPTQTKKRQKKPKTVKFSDQVKTTYRDLDTPSLANALSTSLDYSLPMDQLLSRMNASKTQPKSTFAVPEENPCPGPVLDPEEKQILRDMESQINHFQNLHSVDTILVGGVPATIHVQHNSKTWLPSNLPLQPPLLKPNMTGPVQMAQMGLYNGVRLGESNYKYDPPLSNPQRMAQLFSPTPEEVPKLSLETFTSQMTGDQEPTMKSPPATRLSLYSEPNPLHLHVQWNERSSGAASPQTEAVTSRERSVSLSPIPPVPSRVSPVTAGRPVPPPPRARKSSHFVAIPAQTLSNQPPPLPVKVPNDGFYQSRENNSTANILDDLKALQEEVDKIRDLTGGF